MLRLMAVYERNSANRRRPLPVLGLAAALALAGCSGGNEQDAQTAEAPAEAQPDILAAAWEAAGGRVDGLSFQANGWDACLGQAWSVEEGWPAWELSDYERRIDFTAPASSQSAQRRAGVDPDKVGGCGAQPGQDARPQSSFVDASAAWPDQLAMWLTPQGFLHLAQSRQAEFTPAGDGWQTSLMVNHDGVDYTLEADLAGDYALEQIRTWIDNTVYGDMAVVADFGDYRDFDGLRFPATLDVKQGGFTLLHLDIDSAATFAGTIESPPPRGGPPGGAPGAVEFESIGPGIYAFHGPYQAVAVEFDEYSMVLDGLQSDARVASLISAVKEAIPGKPIRYVLTTHSHFDHASGLRQFAAEGATIITHAMNEAFFREALSQPRTLGGTSGEPEQVEVSIEPVEDSLVISDDSGQRVEFYTLGPSPHAADQVIAYLPSINTIVEADLLQPWINPVFGGGRHPFLVYLDEELQQLGIDYQQFVPIHVPPDPPLMQASELEATLAE